MKGCLKVLIIVFLSLVLLVGNCSFWLYDKFKKIPELAKQEIAESTYHDLISTIDSLFVETNDLSLLKSNLQALESDERLIFLGLSYDDETEEDIIKKFDSDESTKFVFNGFGFAKVDSMDVIVIEREVDKNGIDGCLLYLLPEDEDIEISY